MGKGLILVTGAGGFLGSHVVERLCAQGYAVRASDLPSADLKPASRVGAEVIQADLLDTGALPALFAGVSRVVNVAGIFNYSLPMHVLWEANVLVTRNVCRAALWEGVERFVHISSIAVYGAPESVPIKEDHPLNASNNYERAKKQGEGIVFEFVVKGLPALALRPAGIYGPRSRYGQAVLMALLALVRHSGRRKIPLVEGGPRVQHVHVADVVGALETVLMAPEDKVLGRAFNVGDDTPLTQGELALAIMPALDLEPSVAYPYFTRLYWPFVRVLMSLPQSAYDRLDAYLQERWSDVVTCHGLVPALVPRLERDFLGYMRGDYVLDNAALMSLGYELEYPDARKGLVGALSWYQEQGWLPSFGAF